MPDSRSIGALRRGDSASLARRPGDSMASRQSRPLGGDRRRPRVRPTAACIAISAGYGSIRIESTIACSSARSSAEVPSKSLDRTTTRTRRRRGSTRAIDCQGPARTDCPARERSPRDRTCRTEISRQRQIYPLAGIARQGDVGGTGRLVSGLLGDCRDEVVDSGPTPCPGDLAASKGRCRDRRSGGGRRPSHPAPPMSLRRPGGRQSH